MPPIARRTVLSFNDHAAPRRGSQLTAFVFLYPFGVFGSLPRARPLLRSPTTEPSGFLTNVPTRLVLVSNTLGVRGSYARRLAVGHAAIVMATVQAGRYSNGALAGSYLVGSKFEPCLSNCVNGEA